MSRFTKLFAANTIAAAGLCSAALAMSASAAADPVAPPAVPAIPPALGMIQQFATNPASMGAVLQTAATALGGASQIIGGPATSTLPVSPIPGAPGTVPGTAPGTAPVADPAATPAVGPGAALVPLLNQLGVPGNLANLTPSSMPFPIQIGDNIGIAPAPPAAPVTGPLPTAPQPLAPPTGGVASPLPLLDALP